MKDNKNNQEIKFQIETELFEIRKQNKPNLKKTIKIAEKNLRKVLQNMVSGRSGDC